MSNNSGGVVVTLKKQVIHQACQLKEAERRISLLMDRHKKMTSLLKAAQAGSSKRDERIKRLEGKLKRRDDKEATLAQSITKVVKAIFGKQYLHEPSFCGMTLFMIVTCCSYVS